LEDDSSFDPLPGFEVFRELHPEFGLRNPGVLSRNDGGPFG
jgi:hypothetical protein